MPVDSELVVSTQGRAVARGSNPSILEHAIHIVRMRLLPLLILMYVLDFLDRSNLSYVKSVFQADTGISNAAYAFGAGVLFVGYSFFAVPANLILHRIGARLWLCGICVAWGMIAACMAFARTETWFYSLRFLLGLAEAGFFPGVIFYLTKWFPERERGQAFGLFYWGFPLSMVLGGPFSGWLLDIGAHWGTASWQVLFVVEGLMASVVGLLALAYLVDGPENAHWLKLEEQKALLDSLSIEEGKKRSSATALSVLKNVRVLFFGLIFFAIQVSVYGVVFYLPERIARSMRSSVGFRVGLVTAIPWVCSIIVTRLATLYGDRTKQYRSLAAIMMFLAAAGITTSAFSDNPYFVVIAFSVAASGFVAAQPLFWTLPSSYLSGVAAAGGIGLINCIGNFGGFAAPSIKTYAESAVGNVHAGMYSLALVGLLACPLLLVCRRVSSK